MIASRVRTGLEVLLEKPSLLRASRFGLLMNQASVDRRHRYACDLLAAAFPGRLTAIFSPQHGLWCEEQDNMIETPHGVYPPLEVPVFSLYSETRQPTVKMLADIDCMLVDLQDVGTRVYTFVWTVSHCLEACAQADIPVMVLDRPNPLGGAVFEGPVLGPDYSSFVGRAAVPMRHGLTIGEMARFVNEELDIGPYLQVIEMDGWRRAMLFAETGLPWIPPSPNMPRVETAVVYPGAVLVEGTHLSEGRGTTTPFEVIGAPYIDPFELVDALTEYSTPGLVLRPVRFRPTFNKWANQSCGGVALAYSDAASVRSYVALLSILACVRRLYPDEFAWQTAPYEYETERPPIDILSGSDRLRQALDNDRTSPEDVLRLAELDSQAWRDRISPYLLYAD